MICFFEALHNTEQALHQLEHHDDFHMMCCDANTALVECEPLSAPALRFFPGIVWFDRVCASGSIKPY